FNLTAGACEFFHELPASSRTRHMTRLPRGLVHTIHGSADDEIPGSVTSGLPTSLAHLGRRGKSKTLIYCICRRFAQLKHRRRTLICPDDHELPWHRRQGSYCIHRYADNPCVDAVMSR